MFKKKPHIKTLAPLRSSDRRKIADQIIAEYSLEVSKLEDGVAESEEQTGSGSGIGSLRNSLLPDGSLSAKFTTTVGHDLETVTGTVFVGAYPGEEPRILWLRLNENIIPTVYTLWRLPGLLPLLHTPEVVLQKMQGGADLMTPGLGRGPPFPSKAKIGAVVAVASLERPSVPAVVGMCEIDVSSLSQVQGAKGQAVRGLHWAGDEIWAWSSGGKPGGRTPDHLDGWDEVEEQEDSSLDGEVAQMSLGDVEGVDDDGGVALGFDPSQHNPHVEGDEVPAFEEGSVVSKDLSTKETDEIFRNAFLYALHELRKTNKDDVNHGLKFPIPQSQLMSQLVLPYLPIFSSEDANAMQIKKTSWKNVKKFIKALEKDKLIKSKDRNGGETVVQEAHFDDPAIINFVPYKLPRKESTGADAGTGNGASASGNSQTDASIGQRLKILTLLKPKEKITSIISSTASKPYYLPTEIRPMVDSYLTSESLISPTNKRLVKLNPYLSNALFDSHQSLDREVLAKGTIPREILIERILQSCAPHWVILHNDTPSETAKPKAGNPPTIKIVLETRSGNKTVTKVSGVEVFHINPQSLADELQKACASSTSVGQLMGSSPKSPIMEILVQGPQKDIVIKSLEKRGVARGWVEVVDKTKGKKR